MDSSESTCDPTFRLTSVVEGHDTQMPIQCKHPRQTSKGVMHMHNRSDHAVDKVSFYNGSIMVHAL